MEERDYVIATMALDLELLGYVIVRQDVPAKNLRQAALSVGAGIINA